ncbi:MAG: cytochrome c3 family protein [Deltaproteobacteria bacterium]|nr:cytochrome c3 family protein [Deltaproteobacteria bacterium]MBK8239283.1 cytochrome c3 family protein [Deltaproteobacteria bacterium]MBK8719642.1 cytochrome c3 family protein [Deltaproteobacteria bacterium]MBP7289662.1 cytochrome c3 family protein [Nannocystaceae bacterium]
MPATFPRWTNNVPIVIGLVAPLIGAGLIFAVWYWFSPWYTDVGYRPEQPIPYSHKLHAGELGIDCRYCHNTVEKAAHAAIPPTSTCLNCHDLVKTDSPRLALLREADANKMPVPWIRVHQLPDYAYFNHSPHVAAGVGCASCHGRVDQMTVVEMDKPLSMGWCLDCHRDPKPNLRPLDQVTNMAWDASETPYDPDRDANRKRKVNPPTHCSGCHR